MIDSGVVLNLFKQINLIQCISQHKYINADTKISPVIKYEFHVTSAVCAATDFYVFWDSYRSLIFFVDFGIVLTLKILHFQPIKTSAEVMYRI